MKRAFTLNELLITIAIIGLLLIVGIPAFQKFSKSQVLYGAAKDVQNAILETQSLSLAPNSASGGSDLQGYMIVINNNGSYNIYEIKNNSGTIFKNFQLSDKLQFAPGSSIAFYFDIAQRGLISFYQQAQTAGSAIDINGANFTKIIGPQKAEIKINYIDNSTLPGKSYTITVYPETALIEVKP
ncbi:MAG: prepilin-type N-terminal cleavage/methylation domain-containing protein [Patescibacteria group bacterium]|nr:prepilin-type N-terminal cleavage/methylation domain-containing protein [Patescibacteria group bacterium]